MGEVNLSIRGKNYGVACDDGQEQRVADLGRYVDSRLQEIAAAGAASSELHLLVLTSIVLADEIQDLRQSLQGTPAAVPAARQRVSEEEENQIVQAIDHLAGRIESVAARLQALDKMAA